jgi:hypothetical protein
MVGGAAEAPGGKPALAAKSANCGERPTGNQRCPRSSDERGAPSEGG